ncbi:hypothetical protein [Streptomyces sp. NPDC058955]|uniref:hypothetical protein n=1 Tax=unclassified Streptomyces TaxID=2593676 RepID=UPI0036562A21
MGEYRERGARVVAVVTLGGGGERGGDPMRRRRVRGHEVVNLAWSQVGAVWRGDGPRPLLAVLDLIDELPCGQAEAYVRCLRLLWPVVVATSRPEHTAALLGAGALNVLDRSAPPGDLNARLSADLRWVRRTDAGLRGSAPRGWRRPASRAAVPPFRTQSLLLDILTSLSGPVCCHDIRGLLGTPELPMSLPALRGRIQRLAPYLAERGVVCGRAVRWGADTITVSAGEESAGRPRAA